MSPVFRHGSLRLYLLRLLDEEPRHGYEVIRLLRDRFMGVYSPSPGTIYPRLARLEEEGLVTHDEVEGRKVYRITEAGREELRNRSDELDELEEELSASVSDIVREVREDVRQTVRSLREELTWAARESRRGAREDAKASAREYGKTAHEEVMDEARGAQSKVSEDAKEQREEARQQREDVKQTRDEVRDEARTRVRQAGEELREQARRAREEFLGSDAARRVHEHAQRLREEAQRARTAAGTGASGTGAAGAGGGTKFTDDSDPFGGAAGDWEGWLGWTGRTGRGWDEWTRLRGRGGWAGLDKGTLRDLERLAVQFAGDLRKLAWQSTAAGENVITDLRVILEEALGRIKTEIFGMAQDEEASQTSESAAEPTATDSDPQQPGTPPTDGSE